MRGFSAFPILLVSECALLSSSILPLLSLNLIGPPVQYYVPSQPDYLDGLLLQSETFRHFPGLWSFFEYLKCGLHRTFASVWTTWMLLPAFIFPNDCQRDCKGNRVRLFLFGRVSADGLAPWNARTIADTVITKFKSRMSKFVASIKELSWIAAFLTITLSKGCKKYTLLMWMLKIH